MANTRAQRDVENWVTDQWLPGLFGQRFRKECLRLSSGGVFEFDAVSEDDRIVACISTSRGKTSGGKYPMGKVHKLRADVLFLTLVSADRRIIVLTASDMHAICLKEARNGRLPPSVEYLLAEIPADLAARCKEAQDDCSQEVRPSQSELLP